jgi:hypothetical protein
MIYALRSGVHGVAGDEAALQFSKRRLEQIEMDLRSGGLGSGAIGIALCAGPEAIFTNDAAAAA